MAKFKIFTDSCSDLSTATRKKYDIEYVHMGIVVDGVEKSADLDWQEYSPEEFYGWLKAGKHVKTTQVSVPEFLDRFTPVLKEGYDIIYIACSSKLSGSVNTCKTLAIPQLLELFPDRKIVAIDTLNATACEGMMAIKASELRKEGKSLEEVVDWIEENKLRFNFFATVDTLTYLKAAGRIKGAKAFFGNIMGVKPIFISDAAGNNSVIKKAKGTKNSIEEIIAAVKEAIEPGEWAEVYVGQGMAQDRAEIIKKRLEEELNIKATIFWIGPIVGTTCGPGVFVGCCFGKEVTFVEGAE
ncbi:MAG: DegV family protein [Bacilli bacterium]|nr:DegV family protein [Bacilli bacterium]